MQDDPAPCVSVTRLADGNVPAALLVETHVHHERAHEWFAGLKKDRFATCPTTQGTLTLDSGFATLHADVAVLLPRLL